MKRLKITTCRELRDLIMEIGFIPLFGNEIDGFSVMDITSGRHWWTGNERADPWVWRMILAEDPDIAYGKVFRGRAGFVSKAWFPYFASYRRDGYDFDTRYEAGKASYRSKRIINLFEKQPLIASYRIRSLAGFSRNGEKGFEGALTLLQMQTYITVRRFTRKQSKAGEYYGWHIGVYSLSEDKFGHKFMKSAYRLGTEGARETLIEQMMKINPGVQYSAADTFLK
jgi:hypothetical protein